ncbi:hypothetical protein ANCDUO_16821 [Ancylostoma duodenale]|uniref:Uncharacterized protein n=1 Tax=Ancylostoma duodenale TaxID=51022 RepID=A0A0C2CTD0_9BILA|nr:hypothetical protein ANCDUO_16821 [Ancylostoma duodenale]
MQSPGTPGMFDYFRYGRCTVIVGGDKQPRTSYAFCGSLTQKIMISVHDRLSRLQRLIAREIYKKKKSIKETELPPSPEH